MRGKGGILRMLLRWLCAGLFWFGPFLYAAAAQEPAPTPSPTPSDKDAGRFKRRPASGRYLDREARFSLQGYVTGSFSDFQEDFPRNGYPPPGQLLVSRTDKSSFQYDWALFLGSRLSQNILFVIETHFVTQDNGSPLPAIVTTEAQVTWMPFENRNAFRLSMGQYWAPFGATQDDWLSAVNLFGTMPYASMAVPIHYNERGIMAEGEFDLGGNRGFNYALSVGNGLSGMSMMDQHGQDVDDDKTLMGRLGFWPVGPRFEIGLSGMSGQFREQGQADAPVTDAHRYGASFQAIGVDARYSRPSLELRAYAIRSTEDLDGAADLDRWGVLAEGALRVARNVPVLREVWLKGRWDRGQGNTLEGPDVEDEVFTAGLNVRPAPRANLKLEGFFHKEHDGRNLRDNGIIAQLSASF